MCWCNTEQTEFVYYFKGQMHCLPILCFITLFKLAYLFLYFYNIILYFLDSTLQLLFFCFRIYQVSIDLIEWITDSNRVENKLIKKFNTFIDCIQFGKWFDIYILYVHFKVTFVDTSLEGMIPSSKSMK
jgi:hypothetical protein